MFQAMKIKDWVGGDYRAVATLDRSVKQLVEAFGFPFEEYEEDGLGLTAAILFQNNQDRFAVVLTRLQSQVPNQSQVELLNGEPHSAEDLDGLLCFLKLTTPNLVWIQPGLEFPAYEIWRQDDHGHQYLMKTVVSRANAIREVEHFESLGHKQSYWFQKSGQS